MKKKTERFSPAAVAQTEGTIEKWKRILRVLERDGDPLATMASIKARIEEYENILAAARAAPPDHYLSLRAREAIRRCPEWLGRFTTPAPRGEEEEG